ncbi:alpha/beta fold hydrolase [Hyphomonas pacifica]|uniref:AB hydrolase-1 domain-containing protein n=1 Tax=Hyphomonas pacifica TaxID=1280941 RepID=A0A062U795_9PROT|nr:alpha/beta hydrolase [Hyphomonas pacifica]KCZ52030.1 hypothetical protein HY2_10015 [Hyphomonas pacifica]RAN34686.1 hypothetical protein HY3_10275 [Hyphomonas pacifica]RAN36239.1 hypothetical protein HY11_12500 [Hyphomonas pacifica]
MQTTPPPQQALPSKRDVYWTSADGLNLYAADYGPKDAALTVLCMHGLTRNHKDFEPMIAGLNLPVRFIAVDVRGRGKSDRAASTEGYLPPVYVQDMAALTKKLNLENLVLAGTSMGGLMSMIMAKVMPEKIRGIILNDVGPVVEPAGLQRIASYAGGNETFRSWVEAAAAIGRTQASVYPDYGADDWMAFAKRTCREADDGSIVFDYDPAIVQGMGATKPDWKTNFAMWRLFGVMKGIPLLIIRGETSDILSDKTAQRMHRRHKGSSLLTISGRGHTPALDEPTSLAGIRAFITGLMD